MTLINIRFEIPFKFAGLCFIHLLIFYYEKNIFTYFSVLCF